ncbi:MAG: tRNA lysidine(34) synthetase TilS [Armatimonadetes bacterium]|nr:tRNA lysidine(34) synthetase TilS [Armatimonadota bacterium]
MLERFRAHLENRKLFPEGSTLLVGYSGGPDSTCLVHLLHSLGYSIVAAHCHHGMRPEADEEADQCAKLCDTLGIPFVLGKADVPSLAEDRRIGLEEAGRIARYEFFERAAGASGCEFIATAHTKSDQFETVLMNLCRGSGLSGLAGIPETRGWIVRPLLPFAREDTRQYCVDHGLWTHDDPANTDIQFARSRIRQIVVPSLTDLYPGAEDAVARCATVVGEEDEFLSGVAAAALESCELANWNGTLKFVTQDCEVALDRGHLRYLHPVILRRAIRVLAKFFTSESPYDLLQDLTNAIRGEGQASFTLPGGNCVVEIDRNEVIARKLDYAVPSRYPVGYPGETDSPEFGWLIRVSEAPTSIPILEPGSLTAIIDGGTIVGQLHLRVAEAGDRMEPLGLGSSKLIHDLYADRKFSRALRKRLPMICDMVGPIWVPGVSIAERVKLRSSTISALRIDFEPLTR